MTKTLDEWEEIFVEELQRIHGLEKDSSHDIGHFRRVAAISNMIASCEENMSDEPSIDRFVVLSAAYFHDVVLIPKNHPDRALASLYSAQKAKEILVRLGVPLEKIEDIFHAIHAHSFSAKVEPATKEAKIIQDADRLESLGALGLMRMFYISGKMKRSPYDPEDIFHENRPQDDTKFAVDHIFCKLLKIPGLLQTASARKFASQRALFLLNFIGELKLDVERGEGAAYDITWLCHQAFDRGLFLFNCDDPFCEKREAHPSLYVLDNLSLQLSLQKPFLHQFFRQLRQELVF